MSRNARRALRRAVIAGMPAFARFYVPDPAGGEGGGGTGGAPAPTAKPAKDPNEGKIVLTPDELAERIKSETANAVRAANEAAAAAQRKKDEDAAAETARKNGEFEKLANTEKDKRTAAERERDEARMTAKTADVRIRLRDFLADKYPDYAKAADWIIPAVKFDLATPDADVMKSVEAAVKKYVEDNPRGRGSTAPGPLGRNSALPGGTKPAAGGAADDAGGRITVGANGSGRGFSAPSRAF